MLSRLKRFHQSGQTHFLTFCCHHLSDSAKQTFEAALERVRRACGLCARISSNPGCCGGWPIQAFFWLEWGSAPNSSDTVLSRLKRFHQSGQTHFITFCCHHRRSSFLADSAQHTFSKRFYDFYIRDRWQLVEKLRYIHRNPVMRELRAAAEDWEWSSFRQYATGAKGRVEIESEWIARKRERAEGRLCPAVALPHSSQHKA